MSQNLHSYEVLALTFLRNRCTGAKTWAGHQSSCLL